MEKSLKDLLSRIPIPGLKESTERHYIADMLSKELQLPITASKIHVKEGVLTIAMPPVVKSALHMRSSQIIEVLTQAGIHVHTIR